MWFFGFVLISHDDIGVEPPCSAVRLTWYAATALTWGPADILDYNFHQHQKVELADGSCSPKKQ